MPFLRSLNRFTDLYRFTFRQIFSFDVWWPLLTFAGVSVIVLLGLAFYTHPALYAVYNTYLVAIGKLTTLLGVSPDVTSQFSHYPAHFRLLAGQFEWVKLPVALLLEGAAIALSARAFARHYAARSGASAIESELPHFGLASWIKVVLVWLLVYLLLSVVTYSLSALFETWLSGSPRRVQIFELGIFTVTNILIAPFVYAFPLFAVGTDSSRRPPAFGRVLRRSIELFGKYPFTSLFLVLAPSFLFVYPLTWSVSPGSGFATKLQPELMIYLLSGLIVGNMLVNFFYAGAATRLIIEENR